MGRGRLWLQNHRGGLVRLGRRGSLSRGALYLSWIERRGRGWQGCRTQARLQALQARGQLAQIHGGLGFTWEQDLHLYFKHARAAELALGSPAFQRELAVRELIDA